jgi:DedD protein
MPPPVTDDDHKRRARRRLIGAVALAIIAVIILPLVLEDEPPPAGPLEVRMPPAALDQKPPANAVEYAPPPANSVIEPMPADPAANAPSADTVGHPEPLKAPPVPLKPVQQEARESKAEQSLPAYTVQIGVFADTVNVQKLQSRISALGLKPYTDDLDGGTRMRVGSFSNRAEAEAVLGRLEAADIKGRVVEK